MKFKPFFFLLVLIISNQAVAEDKLEMEGISIVGNSELPKSLYIVPWKSPDKRASAGKPVNSLINEILAPIEREAFQRRLKYFAVQ
ncbi:hypothetical protein MNBD_GAMMA08-298 [hydrothermal vent metagenome]|uniref:Uncharacterized protein n=1 Tax=hydrothermal vent metagenome TaxID=652676 RepID=A0A3B0X8M9_9ZZZZ